MLSFIISIVTLGIVIYLATTTHIVNIKILLVDSRTSKMMQDIEELKNTVKGQKNQLSAQGILIEGQANQLDHQLEINKTIV